MCVCDPPTSQVFSALMTLRKLCNHPDLVTNDYSEQVTPSKGNKGRANEGQSTFSVDADKDTPKTISIKSMLSNTSCLEQLLYVGWSEWSLFREAKLCEHCRGCIEWLH